MDHSQRGSKRFKCVMFYGENPTSAHIPGLFPHIRITKYVESAFYYIYKVSDSI